MWVSFFFFFFPFPSRFFLSARAHTQGHPLAVTQLKNVDSFSLEKLCFRGLLKKMNNLLHSSLISRSSVSALKRFGLHCHALCSMPSNQILYVNWTIAADRFCSELKGFSPWILISNPQAESRNAKFPQALFRMWGRKNVIHLLSKYYTKDSCFKKEIQVRGLRSQRTCNCKIWKFNIFLILCRVTGFLNKVSK